MVTDFDCWHPQHDAVTVEAIIRVLLGNAAQAKAVVADVAAPAAADAAGAACVGRHALQHALITAPESRDPAMVQRRGIAGTRVGLRSCERTPHTPAIPANDPARRCKCFRRRPTTAVLCALIRPVCGSARGARGSFYSF